MVFIKSISYLARALNLGLRLTANMIDNFLLRILLILILYKVIFSFALLCLFFICLGDLSTGDSVISLSFFPVFINKKDNNSISNDQSEEFLYEPVIVYSNADTDKLQILTDNKGKTGIYLWIHKELNKKYVGSALDLSKRLSYYYSPLALKRADNYISRAIISHTHSAFSLTILEYINISDKSADEARELILEREQYYIDSLLPEYNILSIAGNSLGYKHSDETIVKISGENHHMFGKVGHRLGKTLSTETLALMSLAKKGKTHTPETLAKMSAAKGGGTIYLYNAEKTTLVNSFPSAREAAKYLNLSFPTIIKYARKGEIYKEQWFFSTSLIRQE